MVYKSVILGLVATALALSSSDVIQLKKDDFNDFIKSNDLVLAEFFAPWCAHCKALLPEYEEAATSLKEKNIKLVKVDCTEEADLCQEHGVEGYPTLKVFRGLDNVSPYSGQRKAASITSYMVKQSLPAVSILSKDTLEEFKSADKVVLIAYIDASDKSSNETFTKVAEKLRDTYLFGGVNDAAVADAEDVQVPAIVLYKSFDEGKVTFTEHFDVEAIEKFARAAATPLIGEVGPDTYSGYMSAGIPLAYIFAETPEEREELSTKLKPIAKRHRGKINFATIDAKAFGAHAGNLNLPTDKFPSFAIQDTVNNKKYPYNHEKEINHDDVHQFVEDFVGDKLEASVKSEPIPESNDDPVTVVVAKTYDQIVLDDEKDVLLEFYAPWCGHCKALAEKYETIGKLYAESEFKDKVVIAKIDATANDVPDSIDGFPTIKLFPAGSKGTPALYTGPRTIPDLIQFVKDNSKSKAEVHYEEEEPVDKSPVAPAATPDGETDKEEKEAKDDKKTKEDKEEGHDEL